MVMMVLVVVLVTVESECQRRRTQNCVFEGEVSRSHWLVFMDLEFLGMG